MTTPFIEANAILAMQQGDLEEVRRLVQELLPGERRELAAAATNLADLCNPEYCDVCAGLPVGAWLRYHWACSPRRARTEDGDER